MLVASGLTLLGVDTIVLGWVLLASCVVAPLTGMGVRRRHGLPPLWRQERALRQQARDTEQAPEPARDAEPARVTGPDQR